MATQPISIVYVYFDREREREGGRERLLSPYVTKANHYQYWLGSHYFSLSPYGGCSILAKKQSTYGGCSILAKKEDWTNSTHGGCSILAKKQPSRSIMFL